MRWDRRLIVNNGLISGYGGLVSGVGITNNAQLAENGGNLTIAAGSAGMTNSGTIALQAGYQLRLSGSTLANAGTIDLNSATLAGSGLLNNTSGNVAGPGTITAAFQNAGGMRRESERLDQHQPFTNNGSIQLAGFGANLTGGSIANTRSIQPAYR